MVDLLLFFPRLYLLHNNDEYMAKNILSASGRAADGSYPDGCGAATPVRSGKN